MSKKLIIGAVSGVALFAVAALILSKKYRRDQKDGGFGNNSDNSISRSSHDGKHLAKKARNRAAHQL